MLILVNKEANQSILEGTSALEKDVDLRSASDIWWLTGKEPACQYRRHKSHRFDPWVKSPHPHPSHPIIKQQALLLLTEYSPSALPPFLSLTAATTRVSLTAAVTSIILPDFKEQTE